MKRVKYLTGTLLGIGRLPATPGTWASLMFLPAIYFTIWFAGQPGLILLVAVTSALSVWSAPEAVRRYGEDPGEFVMDEAAGQSVAFLMISFTGMAGTDGMILIAGFLLFRLFDILKPLGIDRLQDLSGSFGILADDLLAGVYSCIVLHCIFFFVS